MSLLVTGMHRSGTSAVAGVVHFLGLTLEGPLMPPTPANPRGYFERVDVMRLNEQWLESLGGSWWAPPTVLPSDWAAVDPRRLATERAALGLADPQPSAWFIKDPRLCLLLPLWDGIVQEALPLVLCVRDPRDVAASLHQRDGLHPRRALALWTAYLSQVLSAAGSRPLLVIDYDRFVDSPMPAVEALARFVSEAGAPPVSPQHVQRAVASVKRGLRRHGGAQPVGVAAAEVDEVVDSYRRLAALHLVDDPVLPPPPELSEWIRSSLADLTEVWRLHNDLALLGERARAEELALRTRAELAEARAQQAEADLSVLRAEVVELSSQRGRAAKGS